MHYVNLSHGFNQLPKSLKRVRVTNSTISGVDSDWLQSLENIEALLVENSNLNTFERTMLPRPAPKLESLTLRNANLTSLPADLTADAPLLTVLNLQQNNITHFDHDSFAPLLTQHPNVTAHLEGNPLECDCHARFLNQIPDNWTTPPCNSPERLRGRYVKNIGISQLICDTASGAH
ncbi:hypothetical protein V5799_031686 [Amblyomma americanum]|uniref:Uncharacterized protein n=1 Tax=Amblyomma americanum TaxID=6943 RepID=A0AAQ4DTB4_AMBAM